MFLAELRVCQPLVGLREVEQISEKRPFFGSRWEWEGGTFSDPDVDKGSERGENKSGENGKVL